MITIKTGDIFESGAQALVNPVNCVGVCGKGLAKQFKERHYKNYLAYKKRCKEKMMTLGFPYATKENDGDLIIINFPTKSHWKYNSNPSAIFMGVLKLKRFIIAKQIKSIAIPALGCGEGYLDWDIVKGMLIKILDEQAEELKDVNIMLYEPYRSES